MATNARAFEKYHRQRTASAYYPLTLAFSYTAYCNGKVIRRGTGETVEMSSFGVRANFAEAVPAEATDLKLSIAWPAMLDDGTKLQFVVEGRPSWDGEKFELLFARYEFRTAPRRPLSLDATASARGPFAFAQAS